MILFTSSPAPRPNSPRPKFPRPNSPRPNSPRPNSPRSNSPTITGRVEESDSEEELFLDHTRRDEEERSEEVDEKLQVIGKKARFKRLDQFGLEDTLFKMKFESKEGSPHLVDIMQSLSDALAKSVDSVKKSFKNDSHQNRQIYITWVDEAIDNGLNGGGWSIQTPTEELVEEHMNLLGSFLQSNKSFELDKTFGVSIKVLSKRHEDYKVTKKGYVPHYPGNKRNIAKKVGLCVIIFLMYGLNIL